MTDQSLLDSIFVCCAGWTPKSPEVLAEFTADLRGDTSITKYNKKTLELSAQKLQIQILQHLMSNCGVKIDAKGQSKQTALMNAAERGYLDVGKFFIDKGTNLDLKCRKGRTALMLALERGYLDVAEELVAQVTNLDLQDNWGRTALMWALERGYLDLAKELIEKGANLDLQDRDGRTALMWALEEGYLDLAKELIAKGANLDLKCRKGRTALMLALERGYLDLAKELVAQVTNLDLQDNWGRTALMWALERGYLDLAKELIEKGANIDLQDRDGRTALINSVLRGHLDVVKFLIDRGANLDLNDWKGETAQSYSAFLRKQDIAKILIRADAPIKVLSPAIKKVADKVQNEKLNPKLRELRYVKEGLDDLESVSQNGELKQKKERFESEMKMQGLTIGNLKAELNNDELDKKALFESLGLDVKGFDRVQINKLVKTATKILDKGLGAKTDPKLVVNELAEQLVVKAEMIRTREKRSFASKVIDKVLGKGPSR